jgi:hypothetical protein
MMKMKLVREHINEFERGNDPLKNLGIGLFTPETYKETIEYLYKIVENDGMFNVVIDMYDDDIYCVFLYECIKNRADEYYLVISYNHKLKNFDMNLKYGGKCVIIKNINDFYKNLEIIKRNEAS